MARYYSNYRMDNLRCHYSFIKDGRLCCSHGGLLGHNAATRVNGHTSHGVDVRVHVSWVCALKGNCRVVLWLRIRCLEEPPRSFPKRLLYVTFLPVEKEYWTSPPPLQHLVSLVFQPVDRTSVPTLTCHLLLHCYFVFNTKTEKWESPNFVSLFRLGLAIRGLFVFMWISQSARQLPQKSAGFLTGMVCNL